VSATEILHTLHPANYDLIWQFADRQPVLPPQTTAEPRAKRSAAARGLGRKSFFSSWSSLSR